MMIPSDKLTIGTDRPRPKRVLTPTLSLEVALADLEGFRISARHLVEVVQAMLGICSSRFSAERLAAVAAVKIPLVLVGVGNGPCAVTIWRRRSH